jgi:hypothetical protein
LFAEGKLYEILLIELNFIYSVIILYKDLSKESVKKEKVECYYIEPILGEDA